MAYKDFKSVPVAELPSVNTDGGDILFVAATGEQPGVPYHMDTTFSYPGGPRQASLVINTPERREYLEHVSERQAQDSLVELSKAIHELTAGVFDIHPFYGAVWATKLTPVSPGFLTDIEGLSDSLKTFLHLVPNGHIFSDTISDEAAEIPLTFTVPSAEASRFFAMRKLLAETGNPNQGSKDQAAGNNLYRPWMNEFARFNPEEILRREPMKLNLGSIALLLETLSDREILKSETAMVRVRYPD